MKHSSLLKYLAGFSKIELKNFKKFIFSPYFNNEKAVTDLLSYLIEKGGKWIPLFQQWKGEEDSPTAKKLDRLLAKDMLKAFLFEDAKSPDSRFRRVVSRSISLVQEFMVVEGIRERQHAHLHERLRLQYLLDHFHLDLFALDQGRKRLDQLFEKLETQDVQKVAELARIKELANHFETRFYGQNLNQGYAAATQLVDHHFVLKKLQSYCAMVNNGKIFQEQVELPFREQVLEMAAHPQFRENPQIQIYLTLLGMLEDRIGVEGESRIQKLLSQNQAVLSDFTMKQVCSFRINIFEYWQKQGRGDFREEIWEIIQLMAREKMVLVQGRVADSYFFKFSKEGFRNGNLLWLQDFIAEYRELLSGPNARVVLEFAHCCTDYLSGAYQSLLHRAFAIQAGATLFQLEIAVLRMKALYLVDEFALESGRIVEMSRYYDQARHLTKRKKELHADLLSGYREFFRLANRLGAVKHGGKAIKDELRQEIIETLIPEGDWLRKELVFLEKTSP